MTFDGTTSTQINFHKKHRSEVHHTFIATDYDVKGIAKFLLRTSLPGLLLLI